MTSYRCASCIEDERLWAAWLEARRRSSSASSSMLSQYAGSSMSGGGSAVGGGSGLRQKSSRASCEEAGHPTSGIMVTSESVCAHMQQPRGPTQVRINTGFEVEGFFGRVTANDGSVRFPRHARAIIYGPGFVSNDTSGRRARWLWPTPDRRCRTGWGARRADRPDFFGTRIVSCPHTGDFALASGVERECVTMSERTDNRGPGLQPRGQPIRISVRGLRS
jgi:hypothetical protein